MTGITVKGLRGFLDPEQQQAWLEGEASPAEYQDRQPVRDLVEQLMGKNPEHRFNFIQARAAAVDEGAIDA